MLIRRAEIDGRTPLDVRIVDGRVAAVAESLDAMPGETVVDAEGGALLPGLHDHHIHLLALAAADRSVRCGPPQVQSEDALVAALRAAAATTQPNEVVRGVGYHESVAGVLDRHVLDRWLPGRAVQIQHRTGALWIVSSAWIEAVGLDDLTNGVPPVERDARQRATGRLYRLDGWVRGVSRRGPPPSLAAVGTRAASFGVTGLTDATLGNALKELRILERAVRVGELEQRLMVMGCSNLPVPRQPGVALGAEKIVLDESSLAEFQSVVWAIAVAHRRERAVAIHAVTRPELVVAAEAFREAGVRRGDRIEHAAVAPPDVAALVAELGLTVVTQPHFVRERGDAYRRDVEARDQPWLYRCRGWDEARVPLGAGTDAPFGDPDPWLAMQAAVDRRTFDGHVMGVAESLDPERALALFTTSADDPGGMPRTIVRGVPADLCLLDRPWRRARDELSSARVAATFVAGRCIWRRDA